MLHLMIMGVNHIAQVYGMPEEVKNWLLDFINYVNDESHDVVGITHRWVMLGPVPFVDKEDNSMDPIETWISQHQLVYTKVCIGLLRMRPLLSYRVAALIKADYNSADSNGEGVIMSKAYAKTILNEGFRISSFYVR